VPGAPVRLERRGAAAFMTVDRPEARNALSSEMRREMIAMCEALRADRDVRVVVLRGAGGKSFISGGDIREFSQTDSVEGFLALERVTEQLYQALEALPMPTVAVVEGFALGGGLMLAACCDLRLCTSDARLGIPIARTIGNCLSPGEYARLTALIGPARVKELILFAELMDAAKAAEWGMITEVVERDGLEARLDALVEQLGGQAPLTMWAVKEAVLRLRRGPSTDTDIMEKVLASEDFREGVAAFLEKRPPRWRNA
jgi:enoyl-CoA hydratase